MPAIADLLFGLPALALFGLGALAIFRAPSLPLVFLAVGATELGHVFALVAFVLAGAAGMFGAVIPAGLLVVAGLALSSSSIRAAYAAPARSQQIAAEFGGKPTLFRWSKLLKPATAHRPGGKRLVIDGPGGSLGLDFYASASAAPAPLVVVVHGGGWMAGNSGELAGWNRWLASQGFAVAAVDYRLVPAAAWPAQRDDVCAAIDFLRDNAAAFGLDADRVVLFGRSAGGQIASAIAADGGHPWLRGCVCLYAPFDLHFAYEHSREDDVLRSRWLLRSYLGGTPEEAAAHYDDASAYGKVTGAAPPFLLLHGHTDELVWFAQSERFAARLAELSVPHVLLKLPWARHAFDFNLTGPGGQALAASLLIFLARVCGPTGFENGRELVTLPACAASS